MHKEQLSIEVILIIFTNFLQITCHLTQVNAPHLNPSQTGRNLIYLPQRDGRLS